MSELLGERIRRLRLERRMKQSALADLCRVSCACVCQWEKAIRVPSSDGMIFCARALGVSLDYLLTGRETPHIAALHRAIRARAPHETLLAMIGGGE